jgi:UDP-N-acetylmuramoyl-tripeptide--D-alanyl-D-alanine ligase
MSALTAAEIARLAPGRVEGDDHAAVDSWAFDSRALAPGACFVALRDARDGHDFVGAAFDAGATVAIVDRPVEVALASARALVHTSDSLRALQAVARSRRRDRLDVQVVAVAGSTGKTSTKDLLAAALAPVGCHANAESFNNEFGLPLTLLNAPEVARVVVTEMGERNPGDLALLCEIAQPQVGVVTNVGLAHAEFLGGPEGVAATLGELLGALPPGGCAVLNADDPWCDRLAARTAAKVITVGRRHDAHYRIDNVQVDAQLRPRFTLNGHPLAVPFHGAHQAENAALAAAVGHEMFGLGFDELAVALAAATPQRWRMELLETADGIALLNDAYNANPTSMEAALVALAHLDVPGRRIAVLGDMRELGIHADAAHRTVGERVAALGLDLVVGVGEGGAAIANAAGGAGATAERVGDARAATDLLDTLLVPGDAVLCKASRAVGLEAVAEHLLARRRSGAAS